MKKILTTVLFLALGLAATAPEARAARDGSTTYAPTVSPADVFSRGTTRLLKTYDFAQHEGFAVLAKRLDTQAKTTVSELSAGYNEMVAPLRQQQAMRTLATAMADFDDKVDTIDNVEVATWESSKSNLITSWENLQGALIEAQRLRS